MHDQFKKNPTCVKATCETSLSPTFDLWVEHIASDAVKLSLLIEATYGY
jgi:hypothetical protein